MPDILTNLSETTHLLADMPRLHDELPANAGLTLADKRILVDQAKVLIAQVYAHLHLKKALYGIDPVQRLTLLQYRLEQTDDEVVTSELEFHRELLSIFHSLHDLHTNYVLPIPYRTVTAILPFLVEEFFDEQQQPHYVVTKIITDFEHPTFKPGVEIILWNGLPIEEAIRRNGENESGSNADARFAVGLRSLTIRPLSLSLPPEEQYIIVNYRNSDGELMTHGFQWLSLTSPASPSAELGTALSGFAGFGSQLMPDPNKLYQESLMGYHLQAEQINTCRKHLYANETETPTVQPLLEGELKTSLPEVIRASTIKSDHGDFAYLRLYSFMLDDDKSFLLEIIQLLQQLPQNGLILDLRGNPGGLITAAEGLLQLFTPEAIEPEKAQFRSDPLVREICRRNTPSMLIPQLDLSPWVASLSRAHASGALYSTGHTITGKRDANSIGQVYTGPVVLITDAYCYSAADMFAAGFRDHKIGPILGASDNTGAGGANVWTHLLLRVLASAPATDESGSLDNVFRELPRFADFRVSSRRMLRVKEEAGMPLEDFGVEPDYRHYLTRQDILEGNSDLYNHAAQILVNLPRYKLDITVDTERCELTIETLSIDRIDWFVDERAAGSLDVENDQVRIKLSASPQKQKITVIGYQVGIKVAVSGQYVVCHAS